MSAPVVIELPTPPRELSPNASREMHPRKRQRIVGETRLDACRASQASLTLEQRAWLKRDACRPFTLHILVGWEKNRKTMDEQNAISILKASLDGVADAIEVDDRHFRIGSINQTRDPEKRGFVRIAIEEAQP